jgi:hypothetical protein
MQDWRWPKRLTGELTTRSLSLVPPRLSCGGSAAPEELREFLAFCSSGVALLAAHHWPKRMAMVMVTATAATTTAGTAATITITGITGTTTIRIAGITERVREMAGSDHTGRRGPSRTGAACVSYQGGDALPRKLAMPPAVPPPRPREAEPKPQKLRRGVPRMPAA